MSDVDSFIQEVTEEVRQDRMFRLWKKYAPYVIAGLVLVIAATAGWSWYRQHQREKARELGGLFLESDIHSVEQQEKLLAEVHGPAVIVARLRVAAAKALSGDTAGAATLYRKIGEDPGVDPVYAGFARLQWVRLSLGNMGADEALAALQPLIGEGKPYRLLALELRAGVKLNSGDVAGAHEDLKAILADPEATRDLRQRAQAMLLSSGGELTTAKGK